MGILTRWLARLIDRDNAKLDAAQWRIYERMSRMPDVWGRAGVVTDASVEPIRRALPGVEIGTMGSDKH